MFYLCGFTCFLGAASFYFLSRVTNREVEILKSVTRVYHLKDLAELLQVEKVCPWIVSVSGSVGSESPIKCEHSGLLGVIVQETAEQHFLKRNWKFSWVQDSALIKPVTKQVPWYLDDGTCCVYVTASAKGVLGSTFTDSSEVFEKAEPSSIFRETLNYLQGLKLLGVRRIEHVLPVGTQLTIVGEAVKDSMGELRIQEPKKGPFYVSRIPLDELISKCYKWPRRFKYASMGLVVVGMILISKPVVEYILERRRKRWLVLPRNRDDQVNDQVNDQCVICFQKKYDTAFDPCGHMCCCMTCYSKLRTINCPICRVPIDHVLKIYQT